MNPDRVLESFLEMVAIESPSWHEAPMAAYCAEKLAEMGFTVTFDASAAETGSDTGNLIAHLPGTVPGRIGFSAHLDTVKPCAGIEAVIEQRHICDDITCRMAEVVYSAGETILSADDKAGIAAIFEGLRSVLESGTPRPDITVLLTTCEEQSLLGAGALADDALAWPENLPAATPEAERDGRFPLFVLDADGAPGTIIMGAPYHWTLRARIEGRAAHAGVEPEEGVSAIQIAAAAVAAMPLGRIDECTTANVGRIEGGVGREYRARRRDAHGGVPFAIRGSRARPARCHDLRLGRSRRPLRRPGGSGLGAGLPGCRARARRRHRRAFGGRCGHLRP